MNNTKGLHKESKVPKINTITEKRRVGNQGEDIACIYLEKAGHKVVDRNYLKKYGELDIVSIKEGIYHFVEVKTVTRKTPRLSKKGNSSVNHETDAYRPEDNMHPWKLKRLARTIQAYSSEKNITENWQFDVITVVLNMETRRARVELLSNIVL